MNFSHDLGLFLVLLLCFSNGCRHVNTANDKNARTITKGMERFACQCWWIQTKYWRVYSIPICGVGVINHTWPDSNKWFVGWVDLLSMIDLLLCTQDEWPSQHASTRSRKVSVKTSTLLRFQISHYDAICADTVSCVVLCKSHDPTTDWFKLPPFCF